MLFDLSSSFLSFEMIGTRTSERESAQVGKSLTSNNFAYCNVYNSVKCVLGGAKLAFNLGLISFEETVELIMFEIFQIAFVNLMELNKKNILVRKRFHKVPLTKFLNCNRKKKDKCKWVFDGSLLFANFSLSLNKNFFVCCAFEEGKLHDKKGLRS